MNKSTDYLGQPILSQLLSLIEKPVIQYYHPQSQSQLSLQTIVSVGSSRKYAVRRIYQLHFVA